MSVRRRAWVMALVAACAALLLPSPTRAQARTLEGRWQLVEQHYGRGQSNLAEPDAELVLEFAADEPDWSGRIHVGPTGTASSPWPAFVSDGRTIAVAVDRLSWSERRDAVRAEYRVRPSATDDLLLLVVEEYAVDPQSGDLAGTVTVSFERQGKTAGSYRLHRRWAPRP